MKKQTYLAVAISALALGACSTRPEGWTVDGRVDGADGGKLALEAFNNGRWIVIDSIATEADGSFKYTSATPAPYPEVMRITLGDGSIYFPVDSVDRVSINASAAHFTTGYTLAGSAQAATISTIDSIINAEVTARGAAAVAADNDLKRRIFEHAFNDESVIPMYYIINKSIGNRQLFDISNPADLRLYRAVAQRFSTDRPDDPRTAFLTTAVSAAAAQGVTTQIEVPETGLFDIVRYDEKGQKHSLADMASKGKVVVLSFTSYDLESSPAYNVILNDIWEKHHDAGLEIYQLAFDQDETMWRIRANNIPWTTVWNSNSDGTEPLLQYNVGALPMTYIIDRQGQISERITEPDKLEAAVAKHI